RVNEKLDMRMSQKQKLTAIDVLNDYTEKELVEIFSKYGEIRNSRQLASKILLCRQRFAIEYTDDLISCIEKVIRGKHFSYLSQVFQAIRIEVNDELNGLKQMLNKSKDVLKKGGRLSVISFHSLEDRLIKNMIKKGNPEGTMIKDEFGNIQRSFKEVNKKIIVPDEDEIKDNIRSRSAKLRIAEKI
ncbi:MAG TPA: 16S rRNA (cytosine(1402)-N(4))-methyltransferase, partial [Saprospiraceae bacterium]|nr:16S rRNA (cytosine(1402)-N(4))-methyltransferase [Saprospiraceae bacterium]